ncbi:UNVERIFIED_CONTAM: hypothetical protein HDU68_009265 [Siphonaria sp. JEL0065]|nr:hypothetical protein HDU68_009265 [Siphonaria sp. JEL0065]
MSKQKAEIERLTRILRGSEQLSFSPIDDRVDVDNNQTYNSAISSPNRLHGHNAKEYDYATSPSNPPNRQHPLHQEAQDTAFFLSNIESLERVLVNLVKGVAVYKLAPRSLIWNIIRDGISGSDLGKELGEYMDAIQGKEQQTLSSEYPGIKVDESEDVLLQVKSLKMKLESEKRAHKMLKRDTAELETLYATSLAKEKELMTFIKETKDQSAAQGTVIEDLEVRIESIQNELSISNEMLERSRNEYKILNETFAKVNESNQKNISHLKNSLGLKQTPSVTSTTASQNGVTTISSATNASTNNIHYATMTIQRLEAELKFQKDKYETDISSFRKLNNELQSQLSKAISNYESIIAEGKTEDDWLSIQKLLKSLETQKHESSKRMENLVETLETTAQKYTVLSENYEYMKTDMKSVKENSFRLKSIVQAKDAIIDDLHEKARIIMEENSNLKTRLKNAIATVTIKTNLLQDLKTKFDAVLSKVDPIQKEAAQSESLRDVNRRLGNDLKCKEVQLQEWKRKFNEMETLVKSIATSTSIATQHQELEATYTDRIKKLQKSLACSEQQVSRLESAIEKSLLEIFQNRQQRQQRVDEFGCLSGVTPEMAVSMSRLSKEFFGVGLYDVIKGPIPSKDVFSTQLHEALEHSDVDKRLPKFVAELCQSF